MLKQIEFLPEYFGQAIENLIIKESPICSSTSIDMLRAYVIAAMPALIQFNGTPVSPTERKLAEENFSHLLSVRAAIASNPFVRNHIAATSAGGGRSGGIRANGAGSAALSGRGRKSSVLNSWSLARRSNARAGGPAVSSSSRNWVNGQTQPSTLNSGDGGNGSTYMDDGGNEGVPSGGQIGQTCGEGELLPAFAQKALFQREVVSEFNECFEKVVQSIIFDTLVSLKTPR